MKMEMYFKEYPGTFTDKRKIRATLTNMGEGEPVKWASPLMQKHLSDEHHEYLTSWNAFKAAFLLNFSDPSKRDRAIREINSLKQTGSAQIYAKQIIEVAIRTDDILQQAASIKDTTTPPSILKKGKTNNYRPTERFPAEIFLRRSQAGDTPLILGLSWLRKANPTICWRDFSLSYQDEEPMKGKLAEIGELPPEIEDFQDVFSEELFKQLPQHRSFDCSINFKEGSELPKPAKAYPMSPAESKAMKEYMEKELLDGKIEPSHSPIASPCFFVRKADGGLRLVVDYRKINDITITDQFPMPLQSDLLEKVKDAKIFSKLDLKSGYNDIRIKAGEEWKTAFRTKDGLFQYCVMPFGLRNAPQIFQRLMNHIFYDMIDVSVIIYLDDILIYSRNREEHTKHLREVLRRIRDNNLYLKLAKCLFYTTEVTYIGIVITPEGISMEKEKIKAVQEWKEPKTVKQLQSFIGFANFYRHFIKDFSTIVKPLTLLTRQEVKWKWGEAEQQAFDRVNEEIGKDPVLIHPDAQKPYFLETDASGVAMGAVLSQRHTDGYLHPIAFLSKSFDDAQTNYDTHDKELLAIITSLEHWRLFLEGTTEPITVYTDHKNLEYWKTAHTFNREHARWYQILSPFNFNIVYRPGKMSEKPDALSRRPDHLDIPNKEQIMIDPKHFLVMKAEVTTDIISQIREAQDEDESIQTLIATVKHKEELPPSVAKQFAKYQWKEELLWYEERIFVPDSKAIRLELLEQYHDSPIAGHQGQAHTLELLSRDYYWPGMKAQVNRYVESCENCQRSKGHKHTAPIRPLPIPSRPWEDIAYDMIVKLPLSNGYDSILVVIDRFSKQAHFIPCIEKTNAKEMAEIFIKEVWKLHGTPRTTISDRGRVFNNEFQRALYEKLGIKPLYSTAYHPETDGLAERTNQWLEGFLRSYCNYAQDDWAKWLPIAEFCHNHQVNSATGKSAFETVYGMHPRWNIAPTTSNVPHAEDMTTQMELIWDEVKASMEFHKAKEIAPRQEYKVGDKVWLMTTNIQTKRPAKKLDNKKAGPFTITEKISSHAYRLDLPNTIKIHNVKPPPIITEAGEEEYEVEKIVAWKKDKEGLRYQVRWKGYDELEDTMERAEKIAQLPEIMERFKKEFPDGPLPPEIKTPGKKKRTIKGKPAYMSVSHSNRYAPLQVP
ncbi:Retrotransposable element Tf2 protein [Rhizoctonia solani]|uniref:Retrotransposable element Tf2 protein n=1 Tax=Rhizoctonia solani TaxID=456999 RepID=A0A8H8T192_9AGAM|nr:Retrotransposable element Tf2 protein [Rhizoctonia solani]QRW25134.1 Retrotransposable element Tf2 protein [Rhizoctonia solani]